MQQPLANGIFIDKRFNIQKQLADNLCNYCYLALDTTQDDRSVVLSFPKTELLIIPGFNAAFKDAWEHLSRARLNGMVKIIGGGIYESHPYAILQHTNHPTLLQLVKEAGGEQPPETVLNWATPLAVILDELHQADYVHSHIRPDSVQIGSQQQIIIGDFITEFALQRLGKFKDALTTLNASDYLSPEFIKSNYSGSYDQYLLATLIYWALSGKAPFASDLGEDYRMRVATTRVPSLPVTQAYSQLFVDVLDQALERNPTKRFAHCREFVNSLQTALQAEPSVEPEPVGQKAVASEQPAQPKQAKSPLVGMKAVAIETVSERPKANPSKAAALSDEAIIAERAYQEPAEKTGKKHLLWWLVVLVGVAGTAYTMLNSHDADQITANSTRNAEPAAVESQSGEVGSVGVAEQSVSTGSIAEVTEVGATSSSSDSASVDSAPGDVVADSVVDASEESADQAIDSASASVGTASDTSEATETSDLNSNAVLQSEDPVADPEQLSVNSLESEASQESGSTQSSTEAFLSESADPDQVADSSPDSSGLEAQVASGSEANEVVTAENDQAVDNEASQEPTVVDTRVNAARPEWEEQLLASEIAAAQALINEVSAPAVTGSAESNGANTSPQNTQSTTPVAPAVTPSPVGATTQSQSRSRNTAQSSVSNQAVTTAQSTSNTNASAQSSPQTERERIRAIKARELARIKAITDDCVIGGKMHREAAVGNLAYVKNCMSVGVSPDITQSNRWTVLHIAARSGYLNMAKLLVAQGAQVNAKAADGSTPLDMAIAARHPSLERFILSRGGVRSN
ncbi:ankyrin repeat domain-containing protein [Leucothrix mucor]|uniref:ankyrin repeat domain-containing protein n=1 Tax=Leucothrix mucor TaxID=45248 RepID=UPI0003B44950|nr:ankyrin repeat domain-containing protein [Leucothrix mucor]